jgi:hypothetical protein
MKNTVASNQMDYNELIDIAIAPKPKITEELVQKLASVLNRDLYHARSVLNSKIPRVIFQQQDPQRIETLLKQLNDLGLIPLCFKDNEIHKPLQIFKANSLEFVDNSCILKDRNSQRFTLEKNKVFLILKGNLQISREKEIVTNTKKLNITATLLTGGFPISRNVQEKKRETTIGNEGFIRIFEKNSADFCVEIRQQSFNYSCLGKDMSASSAQNINITASKIKDFFAEAFFDDNLNQFPLINTSINPLQSNIDINCRLIYLYHRC